MTETSGMAREQLARILASRQFARATRLRRLLQFIVDETLAGRTAGLKEYSIALAVFDKPESFDPRLDAIVRVQAREMRAKLEAYYQCGGRDDEVVIRCSAGTYVPAFQSREPAPQGHAQTAFWNARLNALESFLGSKDVP